MKSIRRLQPLALALTLAATLLPCPAAAPPNVAAIKKLFAHPPREYSTGPLWVWNDRLTDEQIRSTLRDLAGQRPVCPEGPRFCGVPVWRLKPKDYCRTI